MLTFYSPTSSRQVQITRYLSEIMWNSRTDKQPQLSGNVWTRESLNLFGVPSVTHKCLKLCLLYSLYATKHWFCRGICTTIRGNLSSQTASALIYGENMSQNYSTCLACSTACSTACIKLHSFFFLFRD